MLSLNTIKTYIPIITLVGLFGGLCWLLWEAQRGKFEYQFVSLVTSLVIVAVTIYYAWQLRKSADRTADTLDEMQKDRAKHGKILTIAFGINPLLADLRKDNHSLESNDGDSVELPFLQDWQKPDWAVKSDINQSESYPDFDEDIEIFINDISNYKKGWRDVRERLAENLLEECKNELELITEDGGHSLQSAADQYAQAALSCSQMYLEPSKVNQQITEKASKLRTNQLEKDVCELESQVKEIHSRNRVIGKRLEQVKKEYKEEYGISEHEIKEVAKESPLDDVLTSHTPEPVYNNNQNSDEESV